MKWALLLLAGCAAAAPPREPARLEIPKVAAPPAPEDPSDTEAVVPVLPDDPVRGPRDALVTIVLFADFQDPFTARVVPGLEEVRKHRAADVRVVFKNQTLPFHEHAKLAAAVGQGVLAARGPEAFWRYFDVLFQQPALVTREGIRHTAAECGLTEAELDAGLAKHAWMAKVDRDEQLAPKLGVYATPAMLVNGIRLSAAQMYGGLGAEVDARLVQARSLLDAGTARTALYKAAVASNYREPVPEVEEAEDTTTVWDVPVTGAPARGGAQALVTIVEFGDYQCPFTKRAETAVDEVRRRYGEKVRLVWRDRPMPFHVRANPAALVARAARAQKGDAAFWKVHDGLFASQPALDGDDLMRVAKNAGLDAARAMLAANAGQQQSGIDADLALAAAVDATVTPTFFVNGRRLTRAHRVDDFTAVIDEEIAHATAELAKGTARAALYATLIKNGRKITPPP